VVGYFVLAHVKGPDNDKFQLLFHDYKNTYN